MRLFSFFSWSRLKGAAVVSFFGASSRRRRRIRTLSRVFSPLFHARLDTLIKTRFDVLLQSEHKDKAKTTQTVAASESL